MEVLQSNLEKLERLRAIVNDTLLLTRAHQDERAIILMPASIADEVSKTAEFLDFIMDEAQVSLRVQGGACVHIETSLFRRTVTNLFHNTTQHPHACAEIVVNVSDDRSGARIGVSNPGDDRPKEHLLPSFDCFYRVDAARANSWERHGLALSIVKAIATMHNGSVFESRQDGATVSGFSVMTVDLHK